MVIFLIIICAMALGAFLVWAWAVSQPDEPDEAARNRRIDRNLEEIEDELQRLKDE